MRKLIGRLLTWLMEPQCHPHNSQRNGLAAALRASGVPNVRDLAARVAELERYAPLARASTDSRA